MSFMKNLGVTFVLFAVLAGAVYFVVLPKLSSEKSERLSALVKNEIEQCAELTTLKSNYSEVVSVKKRTVMGKSYSIVRYAGVIRGGIADLRTASIHIAGERDAVTVTLPHAVILSNDISKIEVFDESKSLFAPLITTQDVLTEVNNSRDEALNRVVNSGFLRETEAHTKLLVTRLLSAMGFKTVNVKFA
ncbi:MAG: hypothetical protein Ta2A_12850 [Treponemataceae bacterium]|nr:MAG: hypothetical protein Ta2A_12850 [Treponemataceae bacterium]